MLDVPPSTLENGEYYVQGDAVWRAPIIKRRPTGGAEITVGFRVCDASPWVNAEDIARCLTAAAQLPAALNAFDTAMTVADQARIEWDEAPKGMKAGKLLIALTDAGFRYRADISEMHAAITEAKRVAEECSTSKSEAK